MRLPRPNVMHPCSPVLPLSHSHGTLCQVARLSMTHPNSHRAYGGPIHGLSGIALSLLGPHPEPAFRRPFSRLWVSLVYLPSLQVQLTENIVPCGQRSLEMPPDSHMPALISLTASVSLPGIHRPFSEDQRAGWLFGSGVGDSQCLASTGFRVLRWHKPTFPFSPQLSQGMRGMVTQMHLSTLRPK